ncbi:TPA: hypothetical protein ACQ30S_004108 [Yersinia enterocolitica]
MLVHVESLDHLLAESDADSMDWNDGGGHKAASELLGKFTAADWAELEARCHVRNSKWRECLATVVRPQYGVAASQLLLALANDTTGEVAFYALLGIAFYCGVNANSDGGFLDPRIQNLSFLEAARRSPRLPEAIQRTTRHCSAHFNSRFELLAQILQP